MSITGKESIQKPDNPGKKEKVDSIINKEKKTPPPRKNKQEYIGVTSDKARESDDSQSDTDGCSRNLGNEHKNEEYDK